MSSDTGPDLGHPLPLTGERTLPDVPDERYWFERHVVAYELAAELLAGLRPAWPGPLRALDAGCGEGYGLPRLRRAGADRVLGVDLDATTAAHARRRYATDDDHLEVMVAELGHLPLPDDEVAICVSLQVIEHLHDIAGYLRELGRVTAGGGRLVLSTPNRLTFTPNSPTPLNPFHTREFTAQELRAELTATGLQVRWLGGVHHGARLRAEQDALGIDLLTVLTTTAAEDWPDPVRRLVHRVSWRWFELRADDLDTSLDLIAVCEVP
ncbi:MAG: class I SAM-dependent methyltransferase [Actinomycetota bacterium]